MAGDKSQTIKEVLQADAKYQNLLAEHRRLDEQIQKMSQKRFLSPEEEMEKKRCQKLKLKLKDQMAEIERRHRSDS